MKFEHYRSNMWCSDIAWYVYLVSSTIWSIFTSRRYVKRGICRRRVSAGFVLTIASRGPSAIAELLVIKQRKDRIDIVQFEFIVSSLTKSSELSWPASSTRAHTISCGNHAAAVEIPLLSSVVALGHSPLDKFM